MKKRFVDRYSLPIVFGGLLLLSVVAHSVVSYFEARAYTNVTGRHVSTWDAMFLDLRVQEPVAESQPPRAPNAPRPDYEAR